MIRGGFLSAEDRSLAVKSHVLRSTKIGNSSFKCDDCLELVGTLQGAQSPSGDFIKDCIAFAT